MPTLSDTPSLHFIHQLRNQSVRDLAWCCFSPPMMQFLPGIQTQIFPIQKPHRDNNPAVSDPGLWDWLRALDANPSALDEYLAQRKSTRLGIYYEALWHFYFNHHPHWQLLHYNLQIDQGGLTLGALDFLCCRDEQYFHVETAVKFYLCNTNNQQDALAWENWIGPGSNDRLDIKLAHLINHQLPLHQFVGTQKVLHERYPHIREWQSALCLQGYLFSPAAHNFSPAHSHQHHGHGYWWFLRDFLTFLQQLQQPQQSHESQQQKQVETKWIILDRQQWLSPAHINNKDLLLTADELSTLIQTQIQKIKRPLLIAALVEANTTEINTIENTIWGESLRGFVVPDQWPDTNHAPE